MNQSIQRAVERSANVVSKEMMEIRIADLVRSTLKLDDDFYKNYQLVHNAIEGLYGELRGLEDILRQLAEKESADE